ncbi:MAG: AMP-dependent synthetase/ligase [Promethearchaeota archaeon]
MDALSNDTVLITRFLLNSARRYAELDCMRYLKRGEYVGITWEEVLDVTRLFSLGLQSIGVNKGTRVALMSKTRYEWRLVDYGILFAGGTTVTIYPSLTSAQVKYIINDSNTEIIFVDKERNLKKVLEAQPECPNLKYVFSIEPLKAELKTPTVLDLDDLVQKGEQAMKEISPVPEEIQKELKKLKKKIRRSYDEQKILGYLTRFHELDLEILKATQDPFIERYLSIKGDDIATIVYTSGTTGVPKGALLTHHNMAINSIQTSKVIPLKPTDVALAFLPLSHVLERQVGHFIASLIGFTVAYARDTDSLIENFDQVKPTFITSVPRIYEKLYDKVVADVAESEFKEKVFDKAVEWGWDYQMTIQEGEDVSIGLALKNFLVDHLVFKKVRDIFGGRLRFMFSGGAALNPVIAKFFFAAGFKIMEGYGLTETSPVLTLNPLDDIRIGTVGKVIPDTEVKIADDGEIICKGPQVFQGYWNKPAETADAFDEDGWYHTGDLGEFKDGGYLRITGRKKTVIVLRTGKKVSPVNTEAAILLSRYIAHVCTIGDDKKYLIGVIEPNFEYLGEWLEKNGLTSFKPKDFELYKGMKKEEFELVMDRRKQVIEMPEVKEFYNQILQETQKNLSEFERIRRFILVPDEWTEYNLLTPSMKMKRKVIEKYYEKQLNEIYVE